MKVHEYQAKAFFADYGLPVDRSILCRTVEEAVTAYRTLGGCKSTGAHRRARKGWWREGCQRRRRGSRGCLEDIGYDY